jgi:cyclopropane-fatty-acyl-phospholipid synthase
MKTALRLVDKGLVPKPILRRGIRRLLRERLDEQRLAYGADRETSLGNWVEHMRMSPVAQVPDLANQQHYEVPPIFFEAALGKRLKYSSGYYENEGSTLDQAEEAMLALTCERAELIDGQAVLELGCGWGSLTLWMAEHYPQSCITAVSNSAPQRKHIQARAAERGLTNVEVLTRDMNIFDTEARFDRVVSVEMFEHMRNWEKLLTRVRGWLKDSGRVFLHVFSHHKFAYPFEVKDETDWMSEHFFSGGMMPCHDLVEQLDVPFEMDESWVVPGTHYARTSEDWLKNIEARRTEVLEIFSKTYGADEANQWYQRWRLFFLSCAELFDYNGGKEWQVSHLRLRPQGAEG